MYLDTLLIPLERYILSSIERYKAFFLSFFRKLLD